MTGLALNFVLFLHLVPAVVWIGGIIFVLFAAIPAAKEVIGAEAGKMMGSVSRRFSPLADYSILLLIITGLALAYFRDGIYASVPFYLKTALAVIMISVHFYRGLILTPKIARTEPPHKALLQKLSLDLVKLNFKIGLTVLFFSLLI
jgi:uncharacterized membrane protein